MNQAVCHQRLIRDKEASIGQELLFSAVDRSVSLKQSVVTPVSVEFATPYILRYEWLGCMPGWSEFCFGHFFGTECGGVLVFGHTTGSPVAFSQLLVGERVLQLQRGVNLWWTPKNAASYFITRACQWLKKNTDYTVVTATADEDAGEIGTIYQALNWHYLGVKKHGHPVFIIDGKEIHPKTLYDKHKTSSVDAIKSIYGDRVEIKERTFKHRYVHFLNGTPKGFTALPYPKRRST